MLKFCRFFLGIGTRGCVWICRVGWFSFRMWINPTVHWKTSFTCRVFSTASELSSLWIAAFSSFLVFYALSFYKIAWILNMVLCVCSRLWWQREEPIWFLVFWVVNEPLRFIRIRVLSSVCKPTCWQRKKFNIVYQSNSLHFLISVSVTFYLRF